MIFEFPHDRYRPHRRRGGRRVRDLRHGAHRLEHRDDPHADGQLPRPPTSCRWCASRPPSTTSWRGRSMSGRWGDGADGRERGAGAVDRRFGQIPAGRSPRGAPSASPTTTTPAATSSRKWNAPTTRCCSSRRSRRHGASRTSSDRGRRWHRRPLDRPLRPDRTRSGFPASSPTRPTWRPSSGCWRPATGTGRRPGSWPAPSRTARRFAAGIPGDGVFRRPLDLPAGAAAGTRRPARDALGLSRTTWLRPAATPRAGRGGGHWPTPEWDGFER